MTIETIRVIVLAVTYLILECVCGVIRSAFQNEYGSNMLYWVNNRAHLTHDWLHYVLQPAIVLIIFVWQFL